MAIMDRLKKNTCSDKPIEKKAQLHMDAKEAVLERPCVKKDLIAKPSEPDASEKDDPVERKEVAETDNSSKSAFHAQRDGSVSVQEQADSSEQSTVASDYPVAMAGSGITYDNPKPSSEENTQIAKMQSEFEKLSNPPVLGENADSWSEVAGRYVFGGQGGTFKQIPFLARNADKSKYHKPDLIADIAQIDRLLLLGASIRGESHYGFETVRQDSFVIGDCFAGERRYAIAAIADGLGTAAFSDQLADLLVNNISIGVKEQLQSAVTIDSINWEELANYIWKVSLEFCRRKTGSTDPNDYTELASTLEFVVIDTISEEENAFVHVTIAGDGGSYLISSDGWYAVKRGKQKAGMFISNEVNCLPDKPCNVTVKYGVLKRGEMLLLVTDGLGDGIEESPKLREFYSEKLKGAETLPEFVKIICTSIDQMSDDKTGVLIKHCSRR